MYSFSRTLTLLIYFTIFFTLISGSYERDPIESKGPSTSAPPEVNFIIGGISGSTNRLTEGSSITSITGTGVSSTGYPSISSTTTGTNGTYYGTTTLDDSNPNNYAVLYITIASVSAGVIVIIVGALLIRFEIKRRNGEYDYVDMGI
eukprot:TRINITY_DN233_c0_g1_i1.p1 TRINITY_DN233_c0_g1~~TRINITY_DN233_c0_g1_i1.p1  ORF type:complete len:147 (+),score=7.00 TRINITY_DN233_c0_g1_i1:278-718(+)